MYSQQPRPKWWQLYLTLPLLVSLFVVDYHLKISGRGHEAVQIGILILIYGLMHLWLKANASALSKMDQGEYVGRVTVIEMPWAQDSDSNEAEQSMFLLPDSEIKGVLSDTFEIDYIDAEFEPQERSDSRDVNVESINEMNT